MTLLPTKVDRGIACVLFLGRVRVLCMGIVLADEVFLASSRFDERVASCDLFAARLALLSGQLIELCEEQVCQLNREHVLVVLGKIRWSKLPWLNSRAKTRPKADCSGATHRRTVRRVRCRGQSACGPRAVAASSMARRPSSSNKSSNSCKSFWSG